MIRPAQPDDALEIATYYHDIRQDTVPPAHEVGGIEWYIANRLIPRGSSHVYVENGEIIGWVDVHDGCVDQLYCKRGHTGKGIGRELLNLAKSISPTGLKLYTFQVNAGARRFYAREGFLEILLTDGKTNEERQPDVKLAWNPV